MKKLFSILLAVVATASLFALSTVGVSALEEDPNANAGKRYYLGDINYDGRVAVDDVTALQMHLAGLKKLTPKQTKLADTDEDKGLVVSDVTCMQFYIAKIMDACPENSEGYTVGDEVIFSKGKLASLPKGEEINAKLKAINPEKVVFDFWFEHSDKFAWGDGEILDGTSAGYFAVTNPWFD